MEAVHTTQLTRPEYPSILLSLPTLLCVIALVYRGSLLQLSAHTRVALFLPFTALCIIPPCIYTSLDFGNDHGIAAGHFALVLTVADRFFFSGPNQFLPISGKAESEMKWYEKWWNAFKLSQSQRGAGWDWQVKGTPPIPEHLQKSRFHYIVSRLVRLLLLYVMIDITFVWQRTIPYFRLLPHPHAMSTLPITAQVLCVLSMGSIAYSLLEWLYTIVCVAIVLSGGWSPIECPPLFGDLRDAWTLQGFWGKTWHQSFRRPFTSPSISYMKKFHNLSPATKGSIIVGIAFILSAAQHSFALAAATGFTLGKGALIFFSLQPIGLAAEHLLLSRAPKPVNAAFTALWLGATSRYYIDDLVHAGLWLRNKAPFSIVKGLARGVWWDPNVA